MLIVVAHDAGGAHILASLIERKELPATLVLEGPAKEVFAERLGTPPVTSSLGEAVAKSALLVTGSGWQSDLEWRAIRLGRALGIRTITFLDHWVNYRSRFSRNGIEVLPNEIWVGDDFAMQLAQKEFPEQVKIVLEPNPYFLDLQAKRASFSHDLDGPVLRILYTREPVERTQGFRESDAFNYFLSNLDLFGAKPKQITIRPHPSAVDTGWSPTHSTQYKIHLGGNKPIADEILEHDVVVGCHTMALAVASLLGRLAISAIPPGHGLCSIPIEGIQMLSQMSGSRFC